MLGIESDVKGASGIGALSQAADKVTADKPAGDSDVKVKSDTGDDKGGKASGDTKARGFDAIKSKIAKGAAAAVDTTTNLSETPEAPVPEAYQPNFKFKVLDKEHEIDEILRPVIKDAETEKKIRELHEKAYGLDSVKQDRQTLKSQLGEANERISRTDSALETLNGYVSSGDMESFFSALKIPNDKVLAYAVDLVKRQQDPNYAAQVERSRAEKFDRESYVTQNQQLMASNQQLAVQQRTLELDVHLQRPEVSSVIQAFDAGMGNPGAFKQQVIRIGQAFASSGKDISVNEAVEEALRVIKAANPNIGQPQSPQPGVQVVQPSQKPTIPIVQGRGTSPVKSTYKSIDDLKRRAREIAND